jgi:iron complex outermembrane receptor protein
VQATQAKQTDSTKNLPFIPAPRYRAELRTQLNNTRILKNAYVKIGLDYFFKQNNVFSAFGTETKTPSYTLLNMGFGFDIKTSKKDALSLFFSGENLANIAYQSHLSRLKYAPINPATGLNGIFNMGRNFSIKVIYSL